MKNPKLITLLISKGKEFILIQWVVDPCISLMKYVQDAKCSRVQKATEQILKITVNPLRVTKLR